MVEAKLWGEIFMVPYTFAPKGTMFCDGTILPVTGHLALYSLLENLYGGTPNYDFCLPDLRPLDENGHRRDWRADEPKYVIVVEDGQYPERS